MVTKTTESGVGGWLRYGLPGLVIGLGFAWGMDGRGPSALAQGVGPTTPQVSQTEAAGTGTIALTVSGGGSVQYLYLIDTRAKALAVYRVDPSNPKGTVKLEAARQYQWDLKLSEYNCLPPEVAAIESTVRSLGQQPNR